MSEELDKTFSQQLISLKSFDKDTLLSIQTEVQNILQTFVVDVVNAPVILDMRYFMLLEPSGAQVETIPLDGWMQQLRDLDREHLLLVDASITFLLNGANFKQALPHILERLHKARAQIRHPAITEFGYITLAFSQTPNDNPSNIEDTPKKPQ